MLNIDKKIADLERQLEYLKSERDTCCWRAPVLTDQYGRAWVWSVHEYGAGTPEARYVVKLDGTGLSTQTDYSKECAIAFAQAHFDYNLEFETLLSELTDDEYAELDQQRLEDVRAAVMSKREHGCTAFAFQYYPKETP